MGLVKGQPRAPKLRAPRGHEPYCRTLHPGGAQKETYPLNPASASSTPRDLVEGPKSRFVKGREERRDVFARAPPTARPLKKAASAHCARPALFRPLPGWASAKDTPPFLTLPLLSRHAHPWVSRPSPITLTPKLSVPSTSRTRGGPDSQVLGVSQGVGSSPDAPGLSEGPRAGNSYPGPQFPHLSNGF